MKFSKEIVEKICKHLKAGSTITSACEAVGIHRDTLYEWMNTKSDVSDTIKKAMAIPDKKVENALFKSATGSFRYTERHYEQIKDAEGKITEMKLIKTIKKRALPNVTAQIFYLKNRKPEEWKDKHDLELSGGLEIKAEDIWKARKKADQKKRENGSGKH